MLSAPKQEQWIERNRDALKVRVAMGIGGSLDVFAGKVERAPEILQKQVWNGLQTLQRTFLAHRKNDGIAKFAATVLQKGKKYKQD